MFTIVKKENTATVTCTNPLTGVSQTTLTGTSNESIAYGVLCFAKRESIEPAIVQTSIIYPEEKLSPC